MIRHLLVVAIAGLIGSLAGSAIWSSASPHQILPIAGLALTFTLGGSVALMAVAFRLADKGFSFFQAAVWLFVAGPALGALLLVLLGGMLAAVGALFGLLTSIAFIGALRSLDSYPGPRSNHVLDRSTSHPSSRA